MSSRPPRPRTRARAIRRVPPGSSPGQITPPPGAPAPVISLFGYAPEEFVEARAEGLDEIRAALQRWPVTWINVDGLGDPGTIAALGELFGLHRLALEDVVHVYQRAKVEAYGDQLFVVLRLPEPGARLASEQISLFLGRNWVLTFQERAGDAFDPVRERIRGGQGLLRRSGPDYLAYALLDAGIDSNFPVLEDLGERLEALEDEVVERPRREAVAALHAARRDLLTLRRSIWPLRDVLSQLARDPLPFVTDDTRIYLRDCQDHAAQIIDLLETYREIAAGLLDVYLSSMSNRLNEVMKVLTIIATIFIPLSFVAGLYGMNFDTAASPFNMPELRWRWGYPFALAVMASMAGGMLIWFRRRGWLGGDARGRARRDGADDAP